MKLLIDADGCPVVDIAVRIAVENKVECIIVCDTSHVFEKAGARTVTVSKGAYSVDFALVNMVQKGDVVVTQDYGLAAMCLARNALPISQDGMVYDSGNIDGLLMQRHHAKKICMGGGRMKGQPRRAKEQDIRFVNGLMQLISLEWQQDK